MLCRPILLTAFVLSLTSLCAGQGIDTTAGIGTQARSGGTALGNATNRNSTAGTGTTRGMTPAEAAGLGNRQTARAGGQGFLGRTENAGGSFLGSATGTQGGNNNRVGGQFGNAGRAFGGGQFGGGQFGGGQFGGFSGPDGMGVALRSLCRALDYAEIDYHLRDFDDIIEARGF